MSVSGCIPKKEKGFTLKGMQFEILEATYNQSKG